MVLKLGILIPSLRICIPGDRSHPYKKDRWRLHFYVCDHPSRAENRYDTYNLPLLITLTENNKYEKARTQSVEVETENSKLVDACLLNA